MDSKTKGSLHPESGNALFVVLAVIMIMGGLSVTMLLRTVGSKRATTSNALGTKLLFVAESGLGYNYLMLEGDPLHAVRDTSGYGWDAASQEFVSAVLSLGSSGGKESHSFQFRLQYLSAGTPVVFADRNNPTEPYDSIKVTSAALGGKASRAVAAWYSESGSSPLAGAIISDMIPVGPPGTGKAAGKNGHIILDWSTSDGPQHAIVGDIIANGEVYNNGATQTEANSGSNLLAHTGTITQNLAGTSDEIPDFTSYGGPNQLLDFDRYKAAAQAGAGAVYGSINDFIAGMNAANAASTPLEGIIVIEVDPADAAGNPNITATALPGGINVHGSLVFMFADGTSWDYRRKIQVPVNINPADLSGFVKSDPGTYTTGYPPTYVDPSKQPHMVDISPTYQNFAAGEDLAALMSNNGVLDLHNPVNICGVVYAASFIEVENWKAGVQYFNGAIYGGRGVLLHAKKTSSTSAIVAMHDPLTIDTIETLTGSGSGGGLRRQKFAVVH